MDDAYMTMTEIGLMVGGTCHDVGRWLIQLGFRSAAKKPAMPTAKAWETGMCKMVRRSRHVQCLWHHELAIKAFERAGLLPVEWEAECAEAEPMMVGPFELRRATSRGCDLVNAQGQVVASSYSERCARELVRLANLGYERREASA
jgi:hypothetical protein